MEPSISISDLLSMNYSKDSFEAFAFDTVDTDYADYTFFTPSSCSRVLSPSFTNLFDISETPSSPYQSELTITNSEPSETGETEHIDCEPIEAHKSTASGEVDTSKDSSSGDDERLLAELKSVLSSQTNAIARFLRSLDLPIADLLALCKQYPNLLDDSTHKKRSKYGHRKWLSSTEKRALVKERNREHSHNLRVRRKLYEQIRRQISAKHRTNTL